jgi:hypothetical protein
MSRDHRIPWHTLLGQALADALNGLAYSVSTEEELALRSQRLDVMIIEPRTAYPLLPAADFRSYAIATHFPRKLIKQLPTGGCQRSQAPGLYRLQTGTREVRLVVINQLRRLPHNAPWGLCSAVMSGTDARRLNSTTRAVRSVFTCTT